MRARRPDGRRERAGGGDVIFLDQEHVKKTHAVIVRAAAAHGVLLRRAQTRQRLARIEQSAAGAGDRFDIAARRSRRTGQSLQEVERRALAGQDRARGPFDLKEERARLDCIAVLRVPDDLDGRIQAPKGLVDPGGAADDGLLARDSPSAHFLLRRHERRGDVVRAHVFGKRGFDLAADVDGAGIGEPCAP